MKVGQRHWPDLDLFPSSLQGKKQQTPYFGFWNMYYLKFSFEIEETQVKFSQNGENRSYYSREKDTAPSYLNLLKSACHARIKSGPRPWTSETRKKKKKLVGRKRMYLNNAVLVPDLSISRDAQDSQRVTQNNVKAQFDRQGQLRRRNAVVVTPLLSKHRQRKMNDEQ